MLAISPRVTQITNPSIAVYFIAIHEGLKIHMSVVEKVYAIIRIRMQIEDMFNNYSELYTSGSVAKLTTRVSLKRKFGETNLY